MELYRRGAFYVRSDWLMDYIAVGRNTEFSIWKPRLYSLRDCIRVQGVSITLLYAAVFFPPTFDKMDNFDKTREKKRSVFIFVGWRAFLILKSYRRREDKKKKFTFYN